MSTRTRKELIIWGKGDAAGEGLAADVLVTQGFSGFDPMHPHGGPDKKRDAICDHEGHRYTVACYFPNDSNLISFDKVKEKFLHDLEGVTTVGADGIVFVTNAHLPDGERRILEQLAVEKAGAAAVVYHLERLRVALDAPSGFGARLRYLGIEMTREEQVSFFAVHDQLLRAEVGRLREENKQHHKEAMNKLHEIVNAVSAPKQDKP
jgi:hypothetical protein